MSRAPLPKLERYRAKKGWAFPWYSSYGSDFNYDFNVTIDPGKTQSGRPMAMMAARATMATATKAAAQISRARPSLGRVSRRAAGIEG